MGAVVFVTGGARSGKSRYAERRATELGAPVTYLATMEAGDEELAARIAQHRARRPAEWITIEEPLDVAEALGRCAPGDTALLDCLSLWVSNRLFSAIGDASEPDAATLEHFVDEMVSATQQLLSLQRDREGTLIAVTNEAGMGIVPADRITRYFRDALGLVNQLAAAQADEAVMLVSGLPMRLT